MVRVRLQVFGKNIPGVKHSSQHVILGLRANTMTHHGNMNCIHCCLLGFSMEKLLFSYFQTLLFGSKLSVATTQGRGSMWGINLQLLGGRVSPFITWKSSMRKLHLFSPLRWFIHTFIYISTDLWNHFILWIIIQCYVIYYIAKVFQLLAIGDSFGLLCTFDTPPSFCVLSFLILQS